MLGAGTSYAAVYPGLPAADDTIWQDPDTPAATVMFRGGRVARFRPGQPRRLPRADPPRPGQPGLMLALRWNTLPGSYSVLIAASLSYLAGP